MAEPEGDQRRTRTAARRTTHTSTGESADRRTRAGDRRPRHGDQRLFPAAQLDLSETRRQDQPGLRRRDVVARRPEQDRRREMPVHLRPRRRDQEPGGRRQLDAAIKRFDAADTAWEQQHQSLASTLEIVVNFQFGLDDLAAVAKARTLDCTRYALDGLRPNATDPLPVGAVLEVIYTCQTKLKQSIEAQIVRARLQRRELAAVVAEPDPGRIMFGHVWRVQNVLQCLMVQRAVEIRGQPFGVSLMPFTDAQPAAPYAMTEGDRAREDRCLAPVPRRSDFRDRFDEAHLTASYAQLYCPRQLWACARPIVLQMFRPTRQPGGGRWWRGFRQWRSRGSRRGRSTFRCMSPPARSSSTSSASATRRCANRRSGCARR